MSLRSFLSVLVGRGVAGTQYDADPLRYVTHKYARTHTHTHGDTSP